MRKYLLAFLLAAGSVVTCFAQTTGSSSGGKLSIGFDVALPTGDYSNLYKTGLGGSLKYEIPAGQNFFVTLSGGYMNFSIKDEVVAELQQFGSDQTSAGFVPLKIGAKYYTSPGFFIEGQLGGAIGTASGTGTAFAYSPGLGYTFDGGPEIGVRYEAWSKDGSTFSQFGLRLAYRF
ncbi:MAG TPA: outer membrane beta-barrel protein [Mucilaginibacter sp.]|nr:outer membrane beta-barrel protein [Mucilaginibacter sp.]